MVGVNGKKLGLALGSGGARGSAHVGVLYVLEENGIRPDVIAGASMGAEVGGAYAAGVSVEELEALWRTTHVGRVMRTLLPTIPWAGWSSGAEVVRFVRRLVGDVQIEDLPLPFAAVATDLSSGLPHPITKGSLATAIRASLSIPGLFTPVWLDGRLLVDGGVSNPVPVDVARSLGADVVIGVDVLVRPEEVRLSGIPDWRDRTLGLTAGGPDDVTLALERGRRFYPSVFSVLFQMSTIFQKRVCDLSLSLHPPDVVIQPDFSADPPSYGNVGSGIEAGALATRLAIPRIRELLSAP